MGSDSNRAGQQHKRRNVTALCYAVRAGMPLLFRCALTAEMGTSRRWKMPAASAAAARVLWNTSEKCSGAPAPLLAITGMVTAAAGGARAAQVVGRASRGESAAGSIGAAEAAK